MAEPFAFGLIVGRFQILHSGHTEMIDTALKLCGRVGVLIGSAQEQGTEKNPFSAEERARFLRAVYGGRIGIGAIPDAGLGNTPEWGRHLLRSAEACFGTRPDVIVSGKEGRRTGWFADEPVAEVIVPKHIEVSATQMREWLAEDRFEIWKSFCDEKLWKFYPEMRERILSVQGKTKTDSI